jgi:hypothetical protein
MTNWIFENGYDPINDYLLQHIMGLVDLRYRRQMIVVLIDILYKSGDERSWELVTDTLTRYADYFLGQERTKCDLAETREKLTQLMKSKELQELSHP